MDGHPQPRCASLSHRCASLERVIVDSRLNLTDEVEARRQRVSEQLEQSRRIELGQFFTPSPIATFLSSMFDLRDRPSSLLDPGAGVGSLTAAFVARWGAECSSPLSVTACEVDSSLHDELSATLTSCEQVPNVGADLLEANFIEWSTESLGGLRFEAAPTFSHVVMNPPYRKLANGSHDRNLLRWVGMDAPNLYAAFLALGARLLEPGGQLVAITPRSFANGPYFRSFRRDLLSWVSLRRIHVYDSRDVAFADSEVLQENVVFLAERCDERSSVFVTSSSSPLSSEVTGRLVPYTEVVRPDDSEQFIHLSPDAGVAAVASGVAALPSTIASLGVAVSTGRVVDFRSREHLRAQPEADTVPLIYPTHMADGGLSWPKDGKKPNALVRCEDTDAMLLPAGYYVVVKRFSSKEERRRIVASVIRDGDLPGECWAFENHLNVIHTANHGLDPLLANGMAVWLNSTVVDTAFRQFSGHTQVNATDLRNMRYPARDDLYSLGEAAGSSTLTQEKIDGLVTEHVGALG